MTAGREELAALLLAERDAAQEALKVLSARERQVLQRVCEGALEKEIAAELGISVSTVGCYKVHAYRKTGTGFAGLVALATKAGLV